MSSNESTPVRNPRTPSTRTKKAKNVELYCMCRKPEANRFMICCDSCDEWFHGDCVDITKSDGRMIEKFYCPTCKTENTDLKIIFNQQSEADKKEDIEKRQRRKTRGPRQCLNGDCCVEARPESDYCSDECDQEAVAKLDMESAAIKQKRLETLMPEREKLEKGKRDLEGHRRTLLEYINDVLKKYDGDGNEVAVDYGYVETCTVCEISYGMLVYERHLEGCTGKHRMAIPKSAKSGSSLVCDRHNKKSSTYCKRVKVLCDVHNADNSNIEEGVEVCGWPMVWPKDDDGLLDLEAFLEDGEMHGKMCERSRSGCKTHRGWIKMMLATIDSRLVDNWEKTKEIDRELEENE